MSLVNAEPTLDEIHDTARRLLAAMARHRAAAAALEAVRAAVRGPRDDHDPTPEGRDLLDPLWQAHNDAEDLKLEVEFALCGMLRAAGLDGILCDGRVLTWDFAAEEPEAEGVRVYAACGDWPGIGGRIARPVPSGN